MDKTNYLATISQLQRISSMLESGQENFKARTLHPTHYGRFCPIETPEGTEIGLRKNLALLSRVSTRIDMDKNKFIKDLGSIGLDKEGLDGFEVFLNGLYIGNVNNSKEFVKLLREKRRNNELPPQMSIREDEGLQNINLSTEPGRVLRPLIIVDNGASRLRNEHFVQLEQGDIKWKNLIEKGIIEYIDASEEEESLVAISEEDLTEEHTHLEIDTIGLMGVVTSLVPYGNHDQSSRLNRGSKTQKQALYPAGQNLIVAIMTYEGYNMEDALVLNKGSLERGVGRSYYFRPYSAIEMNYAGGLKDEIVVPDKDTSGYKTEESYRLLEEDGVIYPEANLDEGEVLIGKTSPPKFLSEAREISVRTKKEASITTKQSEDGGFPDPRYFFT